jgi:hypothetical protein
VTSENVIYHLNKNSNILQSQTKIINETRADDDGLIFEHQPQHQQHRYQQQIYRISDGQPTTTQPHSTRNQLIRITD